MEKLLSGLFKKKKFGFGFIQLPVFQLSFVD